MAVVRGEENEVNLAVRLGIRVLLIRFGLPDPVVILNLDLGVSGGDDVSVHPLIRYNRTQGIGTPITHHQGRCT